MNEKEKGTPKDTTKRAKRILMISALALLLAIVVLLLTSYLIDLFDKEQPNANNGNDVEIDFEFYPADFEENIYDDPEYAELIADGIISYCNAQSNVTVGIDRESAIEHGASVEFLVETLYDVIEGDHVGYNARFSDEYYKNNTPLDAFTMQKIYDVTITRISEEAVSEGGNNYTKFLYVIEYRILHNNGTFRRDIGSGSRKQYFTLTDKQGDFKIDSIAT